MPNPRQQELYRMQQGARGGTGPEALSQLLMGLMQMFYKPPPNEWEEEQKGQQRWEWEQRRKQAQLGEEDVAYERGRRERSAALETAEDRQVQERAKLSAVQTGAEGKLAGMPPEAFRDPKALAGLLEAFGTSAVHPRMEQEFSGAAYQEAPPWFQQQRGLVQQGGQFMPPDQARFYAGKEQAGMEQQAAQAKALGEQPRVYIGMGGELTSLMQSQTSSFVESVQDYVRSQVPAGGIGGSDATGPPGGPAAVIEMKNHFGRNEIRRRAAMGEINIPTEEFHALSFEDQEGVYDILLEELTDLINLTLISPQEVDETEAMAMEFAEDNKAVAAKILHKQGIPRPLTRADTSSSRVNYEDIRDAVTRMTSSSPEEQQQGEQDFYEGVESEVGAALGQVAMSFRTDPEVTGILKDLVAKEWVTKEAKQARKAELQADPQALKDLFYGLIVGLPGEEIAPGPVGELGEVVWAVMDAIQGNDPISQGFQIADRKSGGAMTLRFYLFQSGYEMLVDILLGTQQVVGGLTYHQMQDPKRVGPTMPGAPQPRM